jgi:hypothetical protein
LVDIAPGLVAATPPRTCLFRDTDVEPGGR